MITLASLFLVVSLVTLLSGSLAGSLVALVAALAVLASPVLLLLFFVAVAARYFTNPR